ncbi:MAG: chemotaxis protein CheB [Paracoccaceae bacterium]|nr:chemotaxis protein CheB [Paracoccaceae bacterium]
MIGIAASAGGLEAISQLLNALPTDTGASYVIAQHMSPTHKSLMLTLLARETELPIEEIGTGTIPARNTIYLTPPNSDVVMQDGKLSLAKPLGSTGAPKPSADRLFATLAENSGEMAIGIVLSGTGSDGSYGVQAIREAGGITIAQDVSSAKYDGMPVSAAETGCVDLVLSPTQIGQHIGKILAEPRDFEALTRINENPSKMSDLLQILLARTRVDFREYKESTIQRRIQRRMVALGIDDYEDYVRHCRASTTETDALFKDLLISVTRFFRDPDEFESLVPTIAALAESDTNRPIRVWVAGCATGEEAYSIAMMVAEALGGPEHISKERVQIFATDIDKGALERARLGEYPQSALNDVPESYREKYFLLREGRVVMRPELRAVILFSLHNVIQDPPFINVDLVSLRNLLIYFNTRLQERVLGRVYHALSSRGFLFLGRSETIGSLEVDFEPLPDTNRLFRRRAVTRKGLDGPARAALQSDMFWAGRMPAIQSGSGSDVDREMFDTLARSLATNAVLVTAQQDIVRVYGDISPFIELTEASNLNLRLSLLRKPFRDEARSLCIISLKKGERKRGLKQPFEGADFTHIRLEAIPLRLKDAAERYALITIQTYVEEGDETPGEALADNGGDERVRQLQADVATAREALQQTVEELQTSNEELQSVNEELQSTNEELQASNEELETSNEELQSTNEELITVNEELQVNSAELDATRSELEAVLDASPMAILVINSALQINRASDPAQTLFKLPANYIDLHLGECEVPEGFPNLIEIASQVFSSRQTYERSFRQANGVFSIVCAPYATSSGQVRGVNLVINQIESAAMFETRAALAQLEMVQELADVAHFELDVTSNHLKWSGKVFDIHGLDRSVKAPTVEEAIRFYHEDDRDRVAAAVRSAVEQGKPFAFRLRLRRADGKIIKVESQGRPLFDDHGNPSSLVGIFRQLPDDAEIGA